jgi:hypothetical protein
MQDPRKPTGCDPLKFPGGFEAPGPVRPAIPCDPPAETVEKEFVFPEAEEPGAPPAPNYPDPVVYFNSEQTATCADDWKNRAEPLPEGPSVTVPAGTISTKFYFQNAGVLTSQELQFIALQQANGKAGEIEEALLDDPAELSSLLNISLTKATNLVASAAEVRDELDAQAKASAVAALDCGWGNEVQVVTCPTDGDGSPAANRPVNYSTGERGNPVTVDANTFRSTLSQEDANLQAQIAGGTRLACVWTSAAVTRYCSHAGYAGLDPGQLDLALDGGTVLAQETDVNHEGPLYPGDPSRYRINSVTIPADMFDSLISQEDADAIAEAAAIASLDCFYLNSLFSLSCAAGSAVNPPGGVIYTPGSGDSGNPVTIPAETVPSLVSWDDADEQAQNIAADLLDCQWGNRVMTYACNDKDSDASDPLQVEKHVAGYPGSQNLDNKEGVAVPFSSLGATLDMLASPFPRSPVYEVTIPANFVFSTISQADADELAAAYALSQLSCIYCNPRIDPVCTLPDYLVAEGVPAVQDLELPIPLEDVTDEWSIDATLGVPGMVYALPAGGVEGDHWEPVDLYGVPEPPVFLCSADPFEAATIADFSGMIPARDLKPQGITCLYGNDMLYAACRTADLPGGVVDPTHITPDPTHQAYYSPRSTPGFITFAEDTVQATSKADANTLAQILALAQLDCFYESPKMDVFCGASVTEPMPPAANFNTLGLPAYNVPQNQPGYIGGSLVHAASIGHPSKPVNLAYGYGRSYITPTDAYQQALLLGISQLNCFWKNIAKTGLECVAPLVRVGPLGTVKANTFTSYTSQNEADTLAQDLANALTICASPDQLDPDSHLPLTSPLGVTGLEGATCCEVTIDTVASESRLYDMYDAPVALSDNDLEESNHTCAANAKYVYLEASLYWLEGNPAAAPFLVMDSKIKAYNSEKPLWVTPGGGTDPGPGNADSICRRLIAQIEGSENDCSDLRILQSVNTAQKVALRYNPVANNPYPGPAGTFYPVIVDRHSPEKPPDRPAGFTLAAVRTVAGGSWEAAIWKGSLLSLVSVIVFERRTVDGEDINVLVGQNKITKHEALIAPVAAVEDKPYKLNWTGDVYAQWACAVDGTVTDFEITGPGEPVGVDISELNEDLERETEEGLFYVKIGSVDALGNIIQKVTGTIHWAVTVCRGESSTSSGSSSPGSSSGSGGSKDSGSSKDTAIVPATYHSTGYAAWFVVEAPEVRFEDVLTVLIKSEKTFVKLDHRFMEGVEQGTVQVVSACPSSPAMVGAVVKGDLLELSIRTMEEDLLPGSVVVKLTAIRRGFRGLRLPARTEVQFHANEAFIQNRTKPGT